MKNSKICRLCLKSCKAIFHPVEEITKNILEFLLVKMDLDISGNPVKCKECIETIQKCFEFKSLCILTEENIIAILESKHICEINMTQVYLKDVKNNSSLSKVEEVCRFCTKPVTKFFTIDKLDKDINFSNMVQKFLPEVKLSVTNYPVTCSNCLNSLKSYFSFVKNCQDVEEYIKEYCKAKNITKSKVELYNAAKYMLKHRFESDIEKKIPGLNEDVIEEATVFKHESAETYSSDPIKTEIIIKEEQIVETNSADIIDVDTFTTQDSQPVDIYSSDSAVIETFAINGQLFKKCSCSIVSPVKTEVVIKEEQIIEKKSVGSIDMDTITTKEHLVEKLHSDPSDTEALKKESHLSIEEMKNEINDDDDVFSEGCSDESNTDDIDMAEIKLEDIDIESNNTDLERNEEKPKQLQCSYCKFKTRFRGSLSTHLGRIHGIPLLSCHHCVYKTRDEDCFKKHQVLHGDKAKFQCPQCPKVFRKKVNIDGHLLKKHDNLCDLITSKIFSCDDCDYKTTHKTILFRHINVKHLQVQKYQCNYCSHTSLWKYSLERHISSVHLKLRPYNCKCCKKTFTQKHSLDRHILSCNQKKLKRMRRVSNKIYSCDYCTYKSVKERTMTKHIKKHKK